MDFSKEIRNLDIREKEMKLLTFAIIVYFECIPN